MLTVRDVAAHFNTSVSSARRWCEQGKFPNAKMYGRVWLIPESDIQGFVPKKRGRPKRTEAE